MSKLFIFGIGGTGSRVIRSLAMLLASGVEMKNTTQVIPIIIDPDNANGDLTECIDILDTYASIRSRISNSFSGTKRNILRNSFYRTEIGTLNKEPGTEYRYKLKLTPSNQSNDKFGSYIDYDTLDVTNKSLAELIFSGYHKEAGFEKSLFELETHIGVKGNPQIGSVILNQFNPENPDFVRFAHNFSKGDRIFIISSIFGGTGAAGFPLLLKNIRNALKSNPVIDNAAELEKSIIGAITVLPYFKLKSGDIDSQTFISKTKAALEYYAKNVNSSVNCLYYIAYGDNTNNYENNAGADKQKNPAHFVEFASALSVIDFMNQTDNELAETKFKEFGIENFGTSINFLNMDQNTNSIIQKQLTQFLFLTKYLKEQINVSINKQPWSNRGTIKVDKEFLQDIFYSKILKFSNLFLNWLGEMNGNKPAFTPFSLSSGKHNLFESLIGYPIRKTTWKDNYSLFDDQLNQAERIIGNPPVEEKFISVFYNGTKTVIEKKYNIY